MGEGKGVPGLWWWLLWLGVLGYIAGFCLGFTTGWMVAP